MKENVRQSLRDLAFVNAFISIVDDKCAVIENVSNIAECNDINAVIEASGYRVSIWGNGLSISSYENRIVEVKGCISSIELERIKHIAGK